MRRELPPLIDRVDHLVDLARGRRVLHVGCANAPYTSASIAAGTLLHDRLRDVAELLVGVDTDEHGLGLLAERGHAPLIHLDSGFGGRTGEMIPAVDLIIAGEVVEHVDDAGAFLAELRGLMLRDGAELVLTTVNAYCALRAMQYSWPRRGPLSEPVHPDHVAYYSLRTLGLLCARQGLEVSGEAFYDLGPEHRVGLARRHLVVNDVVVRWFPQLADGIVIRCRAGAASSAAN